MPSFDMHFNAAGKVLINNIKDVDGDECYQLTAPYENTGIKEIIDTQTMDSINQSLQQETN